MALPLEALRKLNEKPDARLLRAVDELASARGARQCFQRFHRNRQWTNEQHLQLCRVPAPTFFEEKRAEWMAAQFKGLGWDAKIDRAGNVVAYPDGNREGPFVALTAHLDTVLSPRHIEDVRVGPGGRFHGPGVSDNGAGLAALLAIASCWKERPVAAGNSASLILVANVGEEGEGNLSGMRFLCRQSPLANRIRSYLVLDGPGTEHITCKALASRRFEVLIQGPGGHSWSDHGNANPVHALSRAIHYFTEARFENGPGAARSSYNFGIIEGGVSVNSIPSSARAKLDLRSEDAERIEDLARALSTAVERAIDVENERSAGGRVQARLREIGARPGGGLPGDARILPYLRAVDAHLGIRAHIDCASTDANIPLSMGLEAVSIGAGGSGGGAHTPEEWFDPEGRELGLQRVLLTLCLLLSA
ncbi:MAG: M20/M25/M40 family metallo-hydrolase [Bryobacterales bacterium]|nr:M20/M25/M40 family metallo-hydrolase [Bryobacterales bacterium]MCZ2151128.1 M20/M25/M40 family metallo-hydrolase [Bryobacterales bacterium]